MAKEKAVTGIPTIREKKNEIRSGEIRFFPKNKDKK